MEEVAITEHDEIVMKLLHYFITEQNYNPIILQGAKNEIWLENTNQEYSIVRIVTEYLHNDEQFNFDIFKMRKISTRVKKKMLSFRTKVLCFYLNLGDNVKIEPVNQVANITYVKLGEIEDIKKYDVVTHAFPTITANTEFKEDGLELFVRLTSDINRKNAEDSRMVEDVFAKKKPIITYGIILLNILMFLRMEIFGGGSHDVATLIACGANYRGLVLAGEWERLFTCTFLHIGLLHLLFNMYALYVIGPQLESFYGKIKFLLIYIFSGICGSLLSIIFSSSVSAGASGAIFGLLGALLYFGYHYRLYLGSVIKSQIMPVILINLAFGFLVSGIDNAAHIGGLIAGIFSAMALGVKYKSTTSDRINGIIISLIYISFLVHMALSI